MEKYTIGTVSKNYPEAVQDLVNLTMMVAKDSGIVGASGNTDPDILEEMLCELALNKFLADGEMHWDEHEFVECCQLAAAHTVIRDLKNEGLIDSIEDENGEEVVWITAKGKEITRRITGDYNKEDECI
jgi:hypothetical protein